MTIKKKCTRCDEIKSHKLRGSGLPKAYCIQCTKEYAKEHYEANKVEYLARGAASAPRTRQRMRALIAEIKSSPCTDCGNTYPPCVMEFDHIDPTTKIANVGDMASKGIGITRILAEIEKCEIVCANCHRIRTWRRSRDAT